MDNEKINGQSEHESESENWLDELLAAPEVGQEIGPDEDAISGANLTHPSDAELEQILQEALNTDWLTEEDPAPAEPEPPAEQFHDEEYRDAFGDSGEELEEVFGDAPVTKKAASRPSDSHILRKGRPKKKKGYGLLGIPHLLATVIWLMIIVAIGVSLGRVIWVSAADVLAFGREDKDVSITITAEDTKDLDALAAKLQEAGLIKYQQLFKLYAQLSGVVEEEKIDAGTYTVNTLYDYHALVSALRRGSSRDVVTVMIPEGYTCAQIFALLEEKGVCTVEELENYCLNGEFRERWYLEGLERNNVYWLEGFLFPDTYDFYSNDTAARVLGKLLDGFTNALDSFVVDVRTQLSDLNTSLSAQMKSKGYSQSYIEAHQLTFRDLVIIASLIEKESASTDESYTISSVIYNRLAHPDYLYLNIDAALYYALGGKVDPETGKTLPLTAEDYKLDDPYNTYLYQGLTPGPIANPGINSLNAALNPSETKYYYYALDPEAGTHHFSKTHEEHKKFLASLEG